MMMSLEYLTEEDVAEIKKRTFASSS